MLHKVRMLAQVYQERGFYAPLCLVHCQPEVIVLLQHPALRCGQLLKSWQCLHHLAEVLIHLVGRVFGVGIHRQVGHQRLLLLASRTVAARLSRLAHLFHFLHTLSVGFEVEGAVWLDACRAAHPLCFVDSVIVHNFNKLR